jgi:hypothetical protein
MTRRSPALLVLVLASCAAPRPLPFRIDPADLQPLEPGMEWVYSAGGNETQVRRVGDAVHMGRFECRIVEARTGDAVEAFWMRSERDGLKVYRMSEGGRTFDFDDPMILIRYPASPGVRWKFEERHGPISLEVEGVYESDEEMPVGKGRRRCARIRLLKTVQGRPVLDQTSWYAPGVGLVKTVAAWTEDGREMKRTLELRSCNILVE